MSTTTFTFELSQEDCEIVAAKKGTTADDYDEIKDYLNGWIEHALDEAETEDD